MAEIRLFNSDRSYFSATTPEHLHRMLDVALMAADNAVTEKTLLDARRRWPDEADAHIALYKFYFVTANYQAAEQAVWLALRTAARLAGINRNYRKHTSETADWLKKNGPERFYLFSLKALGVCRLRRGRVLAAYTVLKKLSELDEFDEIGGGSYFQIAESFFH